MYTPPAVPTLVLTSQGCSPGGEMPTNARVHYTSAYTDGTSSAAAAVPKSGFRTLLHAGRACVCLDPFYYSPSITPIRQFTCKKALGKGKSCMKGRPYPYTLSQSVGCIVIKLAYRLLFVHRTETSTMHRAIYVRLSCQPTSKQHLACICLECSFSIVLTKRLLH